MEAPFNSSESDEDSKQPFEFETSNIDSPRLLAKAALEVKAAKVSTVADSYSTLEEMKELNSGTKGDRTTRARMLNPVHEQPYGNGEEKS